LAVSIKKILAELSLGKVITMQELLTAVTYPVVWLICSNVLKIESGLAKLLISLTASILVYVLIGIKRSSKENKENKDDE
jgi:hypothetical protein